MLQVIDSHAHLSKERVLVDIDALLARAQQAGVKGIVNICTDRETLDRGLKLAKAHPWIYNTAATTPHDAAVEGEALLPYIEECAERGLLVAIGETGLDYHYYEETKETQKELFIKTLHLALKTDLPVVIHCRNAFEDFFSIIDAEYKVKGAWAPGVLHCFTGTVKEAEGIIDRGWMLSLSGIVTFKKSQELRQVAKMVPLDQLLIETDTPYLSPQSKRSLPNEPAFIIETAQVIAQEKGISLESLVNATANNAKRFFKVNPF